MNDIVFQDLRNAILSCDPKKAEALAKQIVADGVDVMQAIDVLTSAVREVGDRFRRGEFFLPELVGGGAAMKGAMPILEAEIKRIGRKQSTIHKIVIGTVKGDLHDIGKSMVATMLTAEGFEVIDIGIDTPKEKFMSAISAHSPSILAMSALMTTTAGEMRNVIFALTKIGLRKKIKIIIGGAAISKEFADEIGADGYSSTAPGGAKLAREMLGSGNKGGE